MKLDSFHLISLQLQSTSTRYGCDTKATQSCQIINHKTKRVRVLITPLPAIGKVENTFVLNLYSILMLHTYLTIDLNTSLLCRYVLVLSFDKPFKYTFLNN